MDFSKAKSIKIPQGNVTKIERNGSILWPYMYTHTHTHTQMNIHMKTV